MPGNGEAKEDKDCCDALENDGEEWRHRRAEEEREPQVATCRGCAEPLHAVRQNGQRRQEAREQRQRQDGERQPRRGIEVPEDHRRAERDDRQRQHGQRRWQAWRRGCALHHARNAIDDGQYAAENWSQREARECGQHVEAIAGAIRRGKDRDQQEQQPADNRKNTK